MHDFARKQYVLEVNPQSPWVEGLLKRVKALQSPDDLEDPDPEAEAERVSPQWFRNYQLYVFLIFARAACANNTELTASLNASIMLFACLLECLRRPKHPQTWSLHHL